MEGHVPAPLEGMKRGRLKNAVISRGTCAKARYSEKEREGEKECNLHTQGQHQHSTCMPCPIREVGQG